MQVPALGFLSSGPPSPPAVAWYPRCLPGEASPDPAGVTKYVDGRVPDLVTLRGRAWFRPFSSEVSVSPRAEAGNQEHKQVAPGCSSFQVERQTHSGMCLVPVTRLVSGKARMETRVS